MEMKTAVLNILILVLLSIQVYCKIYEINTPDALKNCFDQKRLNGNSSDPHWDSAHAYCIQKNNWNLLKTAWGNISIETENWVDELLRMSEYEMEGTRTKRQASRRRRRLRIRKEYRILSDTERNNFHRAINMLKRDTSVRPNRYDALGLLHQRLVDDIHHGAAFLPFHRVLLVVCENALRQKIPGVTIPYWDSRLDKPLRDATRSIMWSNSFMGSVRGRVRNGPFRNWNTPAGPLVRNGGQIGDLFDHSTIRAILTRSRLHEIAEPNAVPPYDYEIRHGDVHQWVGGLMEPAETAGFDPIFYLHHSFVDYVWELFRRNQQRRGVNPTTDYPSEYGPASQGPRRPMRLGRLRNIHGMSSMYTSRIYSYEPAPTCSYTNTNCGSKYLRCITRSGTPRCVSVEIISRRQSRRTRRRRRRTRRTNRSRSRRGRRGKRQALNETAVAEVNTFSDGYVGPIYTDQMISPVNDICPSTNPYNVIQNMYLMNGLSDTRVWVYVPVKIVYKRQPEQMQFDSFPVKRGQLDAFQDIYDPTGYSSLIDLFPVKAQPRTCGEMDSIFTKVAVHSDGLNYHGSYREFALLDARQPFDSSIMYVAVKSPQMGPTDVVLTAYGPCGNVCKPHCRDLMGGYKHCDGSIKLTNRGPKGYGEDYGDAVRMLWNAPGPDHLPTINESDIFLHFVCD
ncbi:tyrosinase-like protein 1 [Mytilus edulis]|uniref:tyrosinase-like protein 1 n=1 Tax=Mytilus edulis TaxID=6550 RepID=UPI0039EFDCBD